eukprot:6819220-Prymnesium_polylepis.1
MHCSPTEQKAVANHFTAHLGSTLLLYEELRAAGNAATASPLDLRRRVLLKGKLKLPKASNKDRTSSMDLSARTSGSFNGFCRKAAHHAYRRVTSCRRLSLQPSLGHTSSATANTSTAEIGCHKNTSRGHRRSSGTAEPSSAAASGRPPNLSGGADVIIAKVPTDPALALVIGLRSVPVNTFLIGKSPWPLSISSINEDRLLKEYGLVRSERNEIEGLTGASVGTSPLNCRAAVSLAYDPPLQVAEMQGLTCGATLLRPFPLGRQSGIEPKTARCSICRLFYALSLWLDPAGLRFSGANMNPLPGWLGGAHHIALNMSNNDAPLQLHFALFKGAAGYVLKPDEMCVHADDGEAGVRPTAASMSPTETSPARQSIPRVVSGRAVRWPPPREVLHRTTIEILSLHRCPKRGEQRPCFSGSREACHAFASELSGSPSLPPRNDV